MSVKVPYVGYVEILTHRVLAGHGSGVVCPECPALCHHCGNVGKQGEDHSCPCPFNDHGCPDHTCVTSPGVGAS